jgi:hypothetical protein
MLAPQYDQNAEVLAANGPFSLSNTSRARFPPSIYQAPKQTELEKGQFTLQPAEQLINHQKTASYKRQF